jgi:hypothetical protein
MKWWDREFTHEELMKESRRVLYLLGGVCLLLATLQVLSGAGRRATGFAIVGALYCSAGLARSFWFRFACLTLWTVDLFFTNVVSGRPKVLGLVLMGIGGAFVYKMLKYRGRTEAPGAAGPISDGTN